MTEHRHLGNADHGPVGPGEAGPDDADDGAVGGGIVGVLDRCDPVGARVERGARLDAHALDAVAREMTLGQAALNLPPDRAIERWEQRRKIARLSRGAPPGAGETLYTPDVCKGHADGHGSRIMDRWTREIEQQTGFVRFFPNC